FMMLELLREFGLEILAASGEMDAVRWRHAEHFLSLAERAASGLASTEQVPWMDRLALEHDNLLAALEWSRTAEGADEISLRLAGSLGLFWEVRSYFTEGREQLAASLDSPAGQAPTPARAALLARAAELAFRQSDYPATLELAGESLALYRDEGDGPGAAAALIKLGNAATEMGNYATAMPFLAEALATWRNLGDSHGTARALVSLGWTALRAGDYPTAQVRLKEALDLSRDLGDTRRMGFELAGLGEVALRQGNYAAAQALPEGS